MKKVRSGIYLLILWMAACSQQTQELKIDTSMGAIYIEIYPDQAPITCQNFLRYVESDKYDSAFFYRVVRMDNQPDNEIKIEVIQGGLGFDRLDIEFDPIPHETTDQTGVLHEDGVISMARMEPGSASSEFFICIGDQPQLDFGGRRNPDGQGFAAFGRVTKGMEVVRRIQKQKDKDQMLLENVLINSISTLE